MAQETYGVTLPHGVHPQDVLSAAMVVAGSLPKDVAREVLDTLGITEMARDAREDVKAERAKPKPATQGPFNRLSRPLPSLNHV